ncbi:LOW QUALITY PROTEIN: Hypothetical protein PHPALM_14291 [Phytophthora palmivora]|uniref:Uncharacterized protein n=1 Tax=Phytophthora palmivora TaxID=4796 RepID=A0A2P4XV29_9STRA|nr:LOW QUALITY PROTEIN: Hypothetical protein PHPALM_14291 [Phytophthora palmivora]
MDDVDDTVVAFHSNLVLSSKLNLADYSPNAQSRMILCVGGTRWSGTESLRNGCQRVRSSGNNDHAITAHCVIIFLKQHFRKGQRDGRYLVVHVGLLDHWQDVYISPVWVVDKGVTDIRLIDGYSFPEGESVNDFTDRSNLPPIKYNPPDDISRRIDMLRRNHPHARILVILGDVAGAFGHVPIHAEHTHMFAFIVGDYLVINTACGFGWCGSPAYYHLAGTLINGLYEQIRDGYGDHMQSVPRSITQCAHRSELGASGGDAPITTPVSGSLSGLFWCDDHTCVELDEDTRCCQANIA